MKDWICLTTLSDGFRYFRKTDIVGWYDGMIIYREGDSDSFRAPVKEKAEQIYKKMMDLDEPKFVPASTFDTKGGKRNV